MKRRGFLGWLAGAVAAPAIAKVLPEDEFKGLPDPEPSYSQPIDTRWETCCSVPAYGQSLDDVIYNIEPMETPFLRRSMLFDVKPLDEKIYGPPLLKKRVYL